MLDKGQMKYPEGNFSCIFPFSASGHAVEVKDFWNYWKTAHHGPNAGVTGATGVTAVTGFARIPSFQWLQMLEEHSRDHRVGFACPTCFQRAGVPNDARVEEVDDVDLVPVRNLVELDPNISSTEKDLLLHFEEFTSENLALATSLWRTTVLTTALKVCAL